MVGGCRFPPRPDVKDNITDVLLYVDGELEDTIGSPQTINTASYDNVRIAVLADEENLFNGKIDNVMIFDRALSAEEVEILEAV